jgi:outer membrane immunogenic protein
MKMYRVGLLAFTLTSVAALTSANAADIYIPGPGGYKDGPLVQSWAGFYVGVNGGYGWSDHSDKFAAPSLPFGGLDPKGGFGGGQIGYNWQGVWHPQLVLGVEADIQGSGIKDEATAHGVTFKSNLDWFGTVRGRLGYAFGSSLLYATGGFAFGGIDNEISSTPPPVTSKNSRTANGYTVGGGLEYKFTPAWSAKVEYQFIDLGRNDPALNGHDSCVGTIKCEDDAFHTVRAGINYHFGSGYVPLK